MQYICNGTYQSLSATPQKIPIQPKRVPLWAQRAFDGSLLSSVYDWYQGGGVISSHSYVHGHATLVSIWTSGMKTVAYFPLVFTY